jgi:bifunctional non-homologous end joining protein LigD
VDAVTVVVGGRQLRLTNLDKVLYPETGFTKAEVIDYYTRIAPAMLPHLAGRPVTLTRWPDGVAADPFFTKNVPPHAPQWLRRRTVPTGSDSGSTVEAAFVDDVSGLVFVANLAALEIHVPQWRVDDSGVLLPDLLVVDLDPGAPADLVQCCEVALVARELLQADGLAPAVKTSGGKGLQLLAPVRPRTASDTARYARQLAANLATALPDLVVDRMDRALRRGRVFVDWSQNHIAKNTIAPYSLRGGAVPTASTPITWHEVAACRTASELRFGPEEVLERVATQGDLLQGPGVDPATGTGAPQLPTRD